MLRKIRPIVRGAPPATPRHAAAPSLALAPLALVTAVALVLVIPSALEGAQSASGARSAGEPEPAAGRYTAETAPIIADDIGRFWEAFDLLASARTRDDSIAVLQERYLDPGTPGLADFVRARITGAEQLLATIAAHPRAYASFRGPTLEAARFEPRIREIFRAWAELHPGARFPEVYLVIGRMTSGGTTSPSRILVGAEMYGRTDATPLEELGEWHRQVLAPVERIPVIVAHELIHTQQRYAPDSTLLARVLTEGIADFLAERIAGAHLNPHVHAWAVPRRAELWRDFQQVMGGTDNAGWLYGRRREGEPNDLGYWIGYEIAAAYYERVADPERAVREMLTIRDFPAFLRASGYGASVSPP